LLLAPSPLPQHTWRYGPDLRSLPSSRFSSSCMDGLLASSSKVAQHSGDSMTLSRETSVGATDGAICATRREALVTGSDCGAGASPVRVLHTSGPVPLYLSRRLHRAGCAGHDVDEILVGASSHEGLGPEQSWRQGELEFGCTASAGAVRARPQNLLTALTHKSSQTAASPLAKTVDLW
jgi:hypothetical protein